MTVLKKLTQGFTLIELLIVMAILGVLAVVVLVAINPVEQLAKTRDTGRISGATQMGRAAQAYYTSRNACWPGQSAAPCTSVGLAAWDGELSVIPGLIGYSAYAVVACGEADGADVVNGWCYDMTAAFGAIVYARLESESQNNKCGANNAFIVYSAADGRGGVTCSAGNDLDPLAAGAFVYVQ